MSSKVVEELLGDFFDHQILVKMYHFQTKLFGAHKASDEYLAKFSLNMDRFMESAQGIFGKVEMESFDTDIEMWSDSNIEKNLSKFAKKLRDLDKMLGRHAGLLAIRDEMLADVEQFKYLLTFE